MLAQLLENLARDPTPRLACSHMHPRSTSAKYQESYTTMIRSSGESQNLLGEKHLSGMSMVDDTGAAAVDTGWGMKNANE